MGKRKQKTQPRQNSNQKIISKIGKSSEAPWYTREVHIFTNYRINSNSFKATLKTLFTLHNETVNVWTHLIGAILMLTLAIYSYNHYDYYSQLNIESWKSNAQDQLRPYLNSIHEKEQSLLNYSEKIQNQLIQDIQEAKVEYDIFIDKLKVDYNNIIEQIDTIKQQYNREKYEEVLERIKNEVIRDVEQVNYFINENVKMPNLEEVQKSIQKMKDLLSVTLEDIQNIQFSSDDLSFKQEFGLDMWPIYVFLTTAFICLLSSSIFHLFHIVNYQYYKILLRLDYSCISLLIAGSSYPVHWYSFCEKHFSIIYLITITIISIIVLIVCMQEFMEDQKYKTFKSIMFTSLGICVALPCIHIALANNMLTKVIQYYAGMAFFYLSGVVIYATQFPERKYKQTFDVCGASHQMWHMCVVFAIICTYFGSMKIYHERAQNLCI